MKKTSLLAAGLACTLVLASCESQSYSRKSSSSTTSTSSSSSSKASTAKSSTATSGTSSSKAPSMNKAGMVTTTMAFPTGDARSSAIQVDKMVPAQVTMGQVFDVVLRVTNLTDGSIDNVVVTESMSGNLDVKESSVKAESTGGNHVWKLGNLGPNEYKTINVKGSAKTAERIDNCLSVSYDTALCTSIPVVSPALKLVATGTSAASECDDLVYKYTVTNTGTGSADDVNVKIDLPDGLTDANGRRSITRNVGNLAAGKSAEFTVAAKATKTGKFDHMASAMAANNLTAKSGTVSTTITRPTLSITKTGTEKSFAGRNMTYDIVVKNTGSGVAKNAVLEDAIPSGLSFVSATQGGRQVGNTVQWDLGDMAAGGTATVQLKLKGDTLGTYLNRATARAYCAEAVSDTATTELTGIPAILLEVIDLEDPIEVGSVETYLITVTNQGSAPDHDISIKVTMPANTEYVSAGGATSAMAGAGTGNVITLSPLPTLAPKAKATWQIKLRGASAADARFGVEMNSRVLTSPVIETEATNFYE